MSKQAWKRVSREQYIQLLRYNHIMEIMINFMSNQDGRYSEHNLQELRNYIQEKRKELGGDNEEI